MIVDLTYADILTAIGEAAARQELLRGVGLPDERISAETSLSVEARGIVAERAVADLLGVRWNQSRGVEADPGWDLVTNAGTRIDVKAPARPNYHLAVRADYEPRCDGYVLVLPVPGRLAVEVVGWVSTQQMLATCEVRELRPGVPTRWLHRKHLTPLEEAPL